jgi:hypothetical protein
MEHKDASQRRVIHEWSSDHKFVFGGHLANNSYLFGCILLFQSRSLPPLLLPGSPCGDNFWLAKINRPNLFAPCFTAKRPKIRQFGRLISA